MSAEVAPLESSIGADAQRRRELADFLRTRRERLTPAQVGMPAGMRRRTPGLRREEVAQLAGIGTTWYARLEQQWEIHVSAAALEGIAQALKLTPEERRHLFLLADQAVPSLPAPLSEEVSPTIQNFIDCLGHMPAMVYGRRWDLLATNEAARQVLSLPHTPPYPKNFVWHLFVDPAVREPYDLWEQHAQKVLAEFRADSARYPGDQDFTDLIADLQRISPEFRRWWSRHDVRGLLDGPKELIHPVVGRLMFQHTVFQVPANADIKLMIFVPLPASDTASKLQTLLGPARKDTR